MTTESHLRGNAESPVCGDCPHPLAEHYESGCGWCICKVVGSAVDAPSTSAALLADWREQEVERERTRYPFAAPEDDRCEAVRRAKGNPFDGSDWTILYRCGKRKGHDGSRHACADEGWTMKWGY